MRPNRGRRKTTIWLGPEDRKRIAELRSRKLGVRTDAAAIRLALHLATRPQPDTVRIAHDILQWAKKLKFTSPKEQRELYEWSAELYRIATGRDA